MKKGKVTSATSLLKRKFIKPSDRDYGLVPLMAVWHQKCPHCDVIAVAKSAGGVVARMDSHIRKEHRAKM